MWAEVYFILLLFTRLIDRRTDRQTDGRTVHRNIAAAQQQRGKMIECWTAGDNVSSFSCYISCCATYWLKLNTHVPKFQLTTFFIRLLSLLMHPVAVSRSGGI